MGICVSTGDLCDHSHKFTTLVEILRWHADQQPDNSAFIFLRDGEQDEQVMTYAELDRRARAIAVALIQAGATGERALLVYEPGLDYVAAFFGCLYAGVVAVPAYPLDPLRVRRTLPRLQAIVADAQAHFALTTGSILGWAEHLLRQNGQIRAVIATDSIDESVHRSWQAPQLDGDALAFLQYTSGSTGSPKGVMLTHGNLLHNLSLLDAADSNGTRGVIWLPPYHDMGLIGGILLPVYRGKDAVLMSPLAFVQRPIRWLEAISRYRASSTGGPNFGYELCVQKIDETQCEGLDLSCWTMAFNGAEPIRHETLEAFRKKFARFGFRAEAPFPCYGLAEATLYVSGSDPDSEPVVANFDANALENGFAKQVAAKHGRTRTLIGSGRVSGEQIVRIVDPESLKPCAEGHIGEIWVHGPSVARGYWNRPDETRQTFQAYLPSQDEGPFLRTGDLGFFRNGELFVTGRLKDLIIVGGRNHYPQDIECTVQRCHTALKRDGGAVFSVEQDGGERVMIVQEVLRPHKWDLEAIIHQIREAVFEEHELAVDTVVLIKTSTVPKTTSGKIQRRACRDQFLNGGLRVLAQWPEADPATSDSTPCDVQQPLSPTERRLAALWSEVFGLNDVDRSDNFFDIGGHSLLAMQLLARVRECFGIEFPLRQLFESPSLGEMASAIDALHESRQGIVEQQLSSTKQATSVSLSFNQQQVWLADALSRKHGVYHVGARVDLRGTLDLDALRASLSELMRRHETLRARFEMWQGAPLQRLSDAAAPELRAIDLQSLPPGEQQAALDRLTRELLGEKFDLRHGRLLRCAVVQLDAEAYCLLLAVHHIAVDGWSMDLLLNEWTALYDAAVSGASWPSAATERRYTDFVAWQQEQLERGQEDEQLAYWQQQLRDLSHVRLPADRPPADADQPLSPQRDQIETRLAAGLSQSLNRLARDEGATLYMVLLAAFNVLLYRYSKQTDLAVGSPVACRTHRMWEDVVGYFANTLILRNHLNGDSTFRQLLHHVRNTVLDGLAHQDVPFGRVVEKLALRPSGNGSPPFNVFFALEDLPGSTPSATGLRIEAIRPDYRFMVPVDLGLYVERRADDLRLVLAYHANRFDQATAERMLNALGYLLTHLPQSADQTIDELSHATPAELKQMARWNARRRPFSQNATIDRLFAETARRRPGAIAVRDATGQQLTYEQLDKQSNQLARYLRNLDIGPGHLVGVAMHRRCDMLTGLLGVLKSGAAYVPLDPAYPTERLRLMMDDAGIQWLLTHDALAERCAELRSESTDRRCMVILDRDKAQIADESVEALPPLASPEDLAYTIYTSGSTGRPKGVEISHRAVVNFLESMARRPGMSADDVLLAITTLSFDISVLELFLPLMVGARVELAPANACTDPGILAQWLDRSGATLLQATPTTWRMLTDSGWRPKTGLKMLCGGETLDRQLASRLCVPGTELWNLYGPTETTVWSTVHRVQAVGRETVSIGRPIDNTQIYLLNGCQRPVPIGAVGELYVGGVGVARGYRGQEQLTRERFLPDRFARELPSTTSAASGAAQIKETEAPKMYRTGDLARYRGDGTIEFLGRIDHQVKVRGHRIELGEIEHALREHRDVLDAAVVAQSFGVGDDRLVAYFVSRSPDTPAADALKKLLAERLPGYMMPSYFVRLEELPRTPNGKIDRRALSEQEAASEAGGRQRAITPPGNRVERRVAAIWRELLGVEQLSIDDHFFDVGGHSMLAVRLMAQLEKRFGVRLPLASLLDHPTIEKQAQLLRSGNAQAERPIATLVPIRQGSGASPLFCVHPAGGTVFCYLGLARHLPSHQAIYGLQAQGMDGEAPPHESVEEMASHYVRAVRHKQPNGPYYLAGWSLGGVVAYEMARQLEAAGETIGLLAVFDSLMMPPDRAYDKDDIIGLLVEMLPDADGPTIDEIRQMDDEQQMEHFRRRAEQARLVTPFADEDRLHRVFEVFESNLQAMFRYRPQPLNSGMLVFRATKHVTSLFEDPQLGWQHWARGGIEVQHLPCEHLEIMEEPHIAHVSEHLAHRLDGQRSSNVA